MGNSPCTIQPKQTFKQYIEFKYEKEVKNINELNNANFKNFIVQINSDYYVLEQNKRIYSNYNNIDSKKISFWEREIKENLIYKEPFDLSILEIDDFKNFVDTNPNNKENPITEDLHAYSVNYTEIFVNGIVALQELDKEYREKIVELETQLEIYKNDISFIKIENTQLKTDISMIRTHLGI